MRLIFTRQTDGATFVMGGFQYPFVLSPDTDIAQAKSLDLTGYENSGTDGGYSTASRYQRRPQDIEFTIRERWNDGRGLFQLISQAASFFDPHQDDLSTILFNCEVQSCDKTGSSFVMRDGVVSVPLSAPVQRNQSVANASIGFIFGDPYIYHTSGEGVATATLIPTMATAEKFGREWAATSGAKWTNGTLKTWLVPSVVPGAPVTVNVVTETTVPAEIQISGEVTNPVIINLTNNSQFEYIGTIPSGSTLYVATNGTATLNGLPAPGIWAGRLTARSGNNTFVLNATSSMGGQAQLTIAGAF